jgi:hypothetical protein
VSAALADANKAARVRGAIERDEDREMTRERERERAPLGVDFGGETNFPAVHLVVKLLAHALHHQLTTRLFALRSLFAAPRALLDAGQMTQTLVQQVLVQRREAGTVSSQPGAQWHRTEQHGRMR